MAGFELEVFILYFVVGFFQYLPKTGNFIEPTMVTLFFIII